MAKKKVGIFSLTCDEGCTIYLIEIFNKKLVEWLEKMQIDYFLSMKDGEKDADYDITMIEGVISTKSELEHVKDIRKRSKILIALGSCAINGMPSGQRNIFTPEQKENIKEDLAKYDYLEKCVPVKKVVKIDDEVVGCPIDEQKFIEVFEKYI